MTCNHTHNVPPAHTTRVAITRTDANPYQDKRSLASSLLIGATPKGNVLTAFQSSRAYRRFRFRWLLLPHAPQQRLAPRQLSCKVASLCQRRTAPLFWQSQPWPHDWPHRHHTASCHRSLASATSIAPACHTQPSDRGGHPLPRLPIAMPCVHQ